MKQARLKSGGFVNILEEGDKPVPGEINFTGKELAWARKLGASTNDPEAEKEFWRTVLEKKSASVAYSVFDDFPEASGEKADPTPNSPSDSNAPIQSSAREKFVGEAICRETIEMLKGRGAKTRREREEEAG